MRKKYSVVLILFFYILSQEISASTFYVKDHFFTFGDSLSIKKEPFKKDIKPSLNTKRLRSFSSLDKYDVTSKVKKNHLFPQTGYVFKDVDSLKANKLLKFADKIFKIVEEKQQYIDELNDEELHTLPVALRPKTISNVKYTVGIAKAKFKPQYTELTVFLKIELPTTNSSGSKNTLILGATDIKLSHSGGIIGDTKLSLISQFRLNIDRGAMILTLKGNFENPATYAKIDCFGFKELSVDANLKISSDIVHPVDAEGNKKEGYVSSDFRTVVSDWNNIIVDIKLPEFGIKGINKTTFRLNKAVLDFSDKQNDASIPVAYLNKHHKDHPELWRGIYIESLEVVLPREFKKKSSNERTSFKANNLIIDSQGITGVFEGKNILDINEGDASNWSFSLSYFKIDIETNKLNSGEFNGHISLPISSEKDTLKYTAVFQPNNYKLAIAKKGDIDFDVWRAKVKLHKDSFIEMEVKDGKFRPKASLNGIIDISTGLKKDNVSDKIIDFKGIEFQKLVLQTEAPIFSIGYFGVKGKLKLAKFPVSINDIGFRMTSNNHSKLLIDYNLNLTSEKDGGNGASSKIAIKGIFDDKINHWHYDGIELEKLSVAMDISVAQLRGSVSIFENNDTYGTGFAGEVQLKLKEGAKFEIKAKALFGRKNSFRYWFADAQATFSKGIPIFTGFALNSFGGGLYNKMRMKGVSSQNNSSSDDQIGASSSGVIYEPYEQNSFGFKASTGIIAQNSENLFNATLEFGMAFKRSGGLQDIYFKGSGKLISKLPKDFYTIVSNNLKKISNNKALDPPSGSSAIGLDVFMGYDFVNDVLHSTSDVYVNLGIIKGIKNGRAGWADLYISPDEWHILVGTPEDPLGLEMNLGFCTAKSTSYFMAGYDLPDSAPLPSKVASKLKNKDLKELEDDTRNLNSLKAGKELAFGSSFDFSTGNLSFLIFYAHFSAGAGFDIMIRDYGNAHCKNSSEVIGINGWYADGKAYAYLQGELGLTFKLFGSNKKIPILSNSTAVILQARLPNPSWFKGYLVGNYNLLGGLIKGDYRFKMEVGTKCKVVGGGALDGVLVIGDMSPAKGSKDVDVFANPQVTFNMQINKDFYFSDDEGEKKYRINLEEFSVKKEGKKVIGKIEWNDSKTVAAFNSHKVLPPNSKLKVKAVVSFEKFENGSWQKVKDDGKIATETKETSFTTGAAPKTITWDNVEYMYPVSNQKNFFKEEYGKGYIQLEKDVDYLFKQENSKKEIFFTSSSGKVLKGEYSYNAAEKRIDFDIPDFQNETEYKTKIMLIVDKSAIDSNVKETYKAKDVGTGGNKNTVQIRKTKTTGVISKGEDRELLTYKFRTSKYNTFKEKMDDIVITGNNIAINGNIYHLTQRIRPIEVFDLVDLTGNKYTQNKPLITAEALLKDRYYKNTIYPLLYKGYPLNGTITVRRDISQIGVPPKEAIVPMSFYLSYLENDDEQSLNRDFPFKYYLGYYYYKDYKDLQIQVLKSVPTNLQYKYSNLIENSFPVMLDGVYKTKFRYVLPGNVKKGTSYNLNYTK